MAAEGDASIDSSPSDPVAAPEPAPSPMIASEEAIRRDEALRRDRLLAAIALIAGIGLVLAVPFALREGATFFLPVTAALVVAIALVPPLEWMERRRVPSPLAALVCLALFLGVANIAIASILVPATDWFGLLPERMSRVRTTLRPLIDVYASIQKFVDQAMHLVQQRPPHAVRTVTIETPNSLLDLIATSAPAALVQMFFGLLVVYFFLAGWSRMRRRTIVGRGSFGSAMAMARVIQEVVDATSAYLGTITLINASVGLLLSLALWIIGMPTPLMWGGLVALFNYIPYLGPIAAIVLLAIGGVLVFVDFWYALLPALIFAVIHLIEANLITPTIVGRRLTINPLLILVALSFWGWVWGTTGALLAVPLLIIMKTVFDASGHPDIAGFLFEEGTLAAPHSETEPPPGAA
jgi:predicted PurR-regulated permease PerM